MKLILTHNSQSVSAETTGNITPRRCKCGSDQQIIPLVLIQRSKGNHKYLVGQAALYYQIPSARLSGMCQINVRENTNKEGRTRNNVPQLWCVNAVIVSLSHKVMEIPLVYHFFEGFRMNLFSGPTASIFCC